MVERDLEPVEGEHDLVAAGAEEPRELQDLVHVPLRVVVGVDRARDVGLAAGRGEVAGGRGDRVLGVPGIRDAVAVGVNAPALPGRRHELHPADRPGRARAHVAAEIRLDLVDRRQHLPGNPVGPTRALPDPEQLRIAQRLGNRGRRGRVDERHRVRRERARERSRNRRGVRDHAERVGSRRARQRKRQHRRNRKSLHR